MKADSLDVSPPATAWLTYRSDTVQQIVQYTAQTTVRVTSSIRIKAFQRQCLHSQLPATYGVLITTATAGSSSKLSSCLHTHSTRLTSITLVTTCRCCSFASSSGFCSSYPLKSLLLLLHLCNMSLYSIHDANHPQQSESLALSVASVRIVSLTKMCEPTR